MYSQYRPWLVDTGKKGVYSQYRPWLVDTGEEGGVLTVQILIGGHRERRGCTHSTDPGWWTQDILSTCFTPISLFVPCDFVTNFVLSVCWVPTHIVASRLKAFPGGLRPHNPQPVGEI